MGRLKIVKSKGIVTKRNAKYYFHNAIPYIALITSVVAILKAYNVII